MAYNSYGAIEVTGGGAGALDAINGSLLNDGDVAHVFDHANERIYHYTLDASSAAAESSPDIISPDTNAGNKRWKLLHYASSSYIETLLRNTAAADFVSDSGILSLVNVWTRNQYLDQVTLTDGTTAVDLDTDGNSYLLLEENTTISAPSNINAGEGFVLVVEEDGTGGWTLSFNAVFYFESYESKVNTTAGKKTIYVFYSDDGTNLRGRIFWKED